MSRMSIHESLVKYMYLSSSHGNHYSELTTKIIQSNLNAIQPNLNTLQTSQAG